MMNSIYSYVRNDKNQKVGVVVARSFETDPKVFIGYSKCNSTLEEFDKERGLEIAFDRAEKSYLRENFYPPVSMIPDIKKMIERAKKYFKKDVVYTVENGIIAVENFELEQREEKELKKQIMKEKLREHRKIIDGYNWGK